MAAGEYVSVSSRADSERADIGRERAEISHDPVGEAAELASIRAMSLGFPMPCRRARFRPP